MRARPGYDRTVANHSLWARFVHCQTEVGLGDSAVVKKFREMLQQCFRDALRYDAEN